MGRATSVLLFCITMDPLIGCLNKIPDVLDLKAYMDDNGTGGRGNKWIVEVQTAFDTLDTAGIQVLQHHCLEADLGWKNYHLPQPAFFNGETPVRKGFASLRLALSHSVLRHLTPASRVSTEKKHCRSWLNCVMKA